MKGRNRSKAVPQNSTLTTHRLLDLGYEDFCRNLERFRKNFEIKTICMHGSPLSKYDNRMIWEKYDYKELGILAEPYFDVDFKEVFYITDTGRKWNNESSSVRDRVESGFDIEVKSTGHLIELVKRREDICPTEHTEYTERIREEFCPRNTPSETAESFTGQARKDTKGRNKSNQFCPAEKKRCRAKGFAAARAGEGLLFV